MALKKEIIQDNGVKTSYHKIDSIYVDTKKNEINVIINSYSTEEYRKKEKEFVSCKDEFDLLQEKLDKELFKNPKDDETIKQLTEKINSYVFLENKDYSIKKTELSYDFNDSEVSLTKIYEKLKKEPLFVESVDC